MKRKFWILIIVLIVVVLIVGLIVYPKYINSKNEETVGSKVENEKISDQLTKMFLKYTVSKNDKEEYIEIVGNVESDTRKIVTRVTGEILDVYVEEGDHVKKGQALAKIDDLQYRIDYLSKLIDYENSLNSSQKIRELKKLQLDLAKWNLDNTIIKTPVDGIVKEVNIAVGDAVGKGFVAFTIVDNTSMRISGKVSEVDLKKIEVGMKAILDFRQFGIKLKGTISKVSPVAKNSGGLVFIPVEIKFDEDPQKYGIIPGLTCYVKIILSSVEGFLIPKEALIKNSQGYFVLKQRGEKIERVEVKVGREFSDKIEILEGVEEGDVLILKPSKEELQRLRKLKQKMPLVPTRRLPAGNIRGR